MPMVQTGFSLNGDETNFEMAVDGTTPKEFNVVCPADVRWIIHSIEMTCLDAAIVPANFLGEASALTNGLNLQIHNADSTVVFDFLVGTLPGGSLKTTADLIAGFGTEFTLLDTPGGSADDMLLIHAHSYELVGGAAFGSLTPGQHLVWVVNDDLTGVTSIRAKCAVDQVPLRHGDT